MSGTGNFFKPPRHRRRFFFATADGIPPTTCFRPAQGRVPATFCSGGKQPPESAAAAERAARGKDQFIQGARAVGRGLPEIFKRHDRAGQRVVAEPLGFERAGLDFVFRLPVELANFVHHALADGGVGAGDAEPCDCRNRTGV